MADQNARHHRGRSRAQNQPNRPSRQNQPNDFDYGFAEIPDDWAYNPYPPYARNEGAPLDWTYEEVYWWTPGPYTGMGPRNYVRSDEDILQDVCERLAANGQLDASNLEVNVDNHEVTLKGSVDSRQDKRLAEDIAESVFGVDDIHNELKVNRQGQMSSGQPSGQSAQRQTSQMLSQTSTQSSSQSTQGTRVTNLRQGERVVGIHGNDLGTIKEIHAQDFVLDRTVAPDVHVPFSAIQENTGNLVKINVTSDQIDKQGWKHLLGT